jgi:vacuolar-type H+-ATPase subunit H
MAKKKTTKNVSAGEKLAIGAGLVATAAAGYFLFGPKGKDNRKKVEGWTLKAKGEILEKIEKLDEVSEEKYHQIVEQVVGKYEKAKSRTKKEVAEFEKEAKKYWKNIKRDLAKKTQKKATKVAKKAGKTAKATKKKK